MKTPMFEVRIPTCDRPEMLRRALESLLSQTYSRWTATIFDDSVNDCIKGQVSALKDERIRYVRNMPRLGAAQNIDRCFSGIAEKGAAYGCLLEDDNYWLPEFLHMIAENIPRAAGRVILANQRINEEGQGLLPTTESTRGNWFNEGDIAPTQLRAALLLMEGVSNGGLVWSLDGGSGLMVGRSVRYTALHEACRSLLIQRPFLFLSESKAVWTRLPDLKSARFGDSHRAISRGFQSIRQYVLRTHGEVAVTIAIALAERLSLGDRLAEAVAYAGAAVRAMKIPGRNRRKVVAACVKGYMVRFVEPDPCEIFLRNMQFEDVFSGRKNSSP